MADPSTPEATTDTQTTDRRQPAMSASGLSRARLGRMHDVMAGHVERGHVPGLVTLVSRRGELHVDALGTLAAGGGDPMRRDTIFRIASRATGHRRFLPGRQPRLGVRSVGDHPAR